MNQHEKLGAVEDPLEPSDSELEQIARRTHIGALPARFDPRVPLSWGGGPVCGMWDLDEMKEVRP